MLTSDGNATFVAFIYEDARQIRNIVASEVGAIGFDAGDNSRSSSVSPAIADNFVNSVNVFRVDGEQAS